VIRRLAVLTAALALASALAGAAVAAGVGDVDLAPDRGPADTSKGFPTAFHLIVPDGGSTTSSFTLRNPAAEPRTVRLFPAGASGSAAEGNLKGADGPAPWIVLADQDVTLQANESRRITFEVRDPGGVARGAEAYGSIVIETSRGVITTQAATIVYARIGEPASGLKARLSIILVIIAAVVVAGAAVGHAYRWRRSHRVPPPGGGARRDLAA